MWHGWSVGWVGWLFMGLMMLLVLGTLIVLAFFAIRALMQSGGRSAGQAGSGRGESAMDILNARYARGEIGREEYEEMKRDLKADNG